MAGQQSYFLLCSITTLSFDRDRFLKKNNPFYKIQSKQNKKKIADIPRNKNIYKIFNGDDLMDKVQFDWKYLIPFYGIYALYNAAGSKKGIYYGLNIFITLILFGGGGDSKDPFQEAYENKNYYEAYYAYDGLSDNKKSANKEQYEKVKAEYTAMQESFSEKYKADMEKMSQSAASDDLNNVEESLKTLAKIKTDTAGKYDALKSVESKLMDKLLDLKYAEEKKMISQAAKKGDEAIFKENVDKIALEIDGFKDSEYVKGNTRSLYSQVYKKELANARRVSKGNSKYTKADYEAAAQDMATVLEKISDLDVAIAAKEKLDVIIKSFTMTSRQLMPKLEITKCSCWKYNHPFTMTKCQIKIYNPTARRINRVEVKWDHMGETGKSMDTTYEEFDRYLEPFSSRSFIKDGIFYTGDDKIKKNECAIRDIELEG